MRSLGWAVASTVAADALPISDLARGLTGSFASVLGTTDMEGSIEFQVPLES